MEKDQKKDQKIKPVKIALEIYLKHLPYQDELNELIKFNREKLKELLLDIPQWGIIVKIECPKCNYETRINPASRPRKGDRARLKKFCRHCGAVIVYEITG
jgi:ribosomal protein L33